MNEYPNILKASHSVLLLSRMADFSFDHAGIDLSIGSVIACSGVVAAICKRDGLPVWISMIAVLLFGVLVGVINGSLMSMENSRVYCHMGYDDDCRGLALFLTREFRSEVIRKNLPKSERKDFYVPNSGLYYGEFWRFIWFCFYRNDQNRTYTFAKWVQNMKPLVLSGVNV